MAALPSPTIAGDHSAIYEAYYNVVDPNGLGSVGGLEAARFLKKSGLSDVILSRIWDLSDPGGRGCLDKTGMFTALKLVALVQNGKDLSVNNVNMDVPPPKLGDVPVPKPSKPPPPRNSPLITSIPPSAVDWTIKPMEREKYDKLFESLQPSNGLIPGNKVRNVLMESKLPLETLGKIWDLADQDKDGMLNRHEFVVAMHLVYKALEKYAIPNTLPPELIEPIKKRPTPITVAPIAPAPLAPTPPLINKVEPTVKPEIPPPSLPTAMVKPTTVQNVPWVVAKEEKTKSDALFIKSDVDKDGFVSGQEIKDVFLQSGVPQPVLAHIWALCDIKQSGKLNNEQFALAMWFVARCLKGIEPPATLAPEMIPPSFRTAKPLDGFVENNNTRYSNPELDMITKDIEELSREKLLLETDIAQKEADIKIKSGEIKSLQSELDTLAATLKQLESQKGEAQKRLNDLKAQKAEIDQKMEEVDGDIIKFTEKVDKLRVQAAEQAELVKAQETELNSKKEQLEGLKNEELRLEKQKEESAKKLDNLTSNLQSTQLHISQTKALITNLQEHTRQMNDAIKSCDSAIESSDVTLVADTALRIKPEYRDPEYNSVNGDVKQLNGKVDPFGSQQNSADFSSGFGDDPFKNDPFKSKDAFSSSDPFNASFPDNANTGFSADPFGGSFPPSNAQPDPFNAFGESQKPPDTSEPDKDPFGCDPFAILHAPTRDGSAPPRPTSPSPALPPKKSKQPPPRPAPPRPNLPPPSSRKMGDAFGGGGDEFADFANFDAKFNNNNNGGDNSKPFTSTITDKPNLDFTDDPFRDYRYEDPFNITFDEDPSPGGRQSAPLSGGPFSPPPTGRASAPPAPAALRLPPEDEQLAWAAQESIRLEEDANRRRMRERAELELAIKLSKAESMKRVSS